MDHARIEMFLDDGWSLIGQLHQWLSNSPRTSNDRQTQHDLLSSLQQFWSVAEDLELKRLARISLALEQLLERVCARTLELTSPRLELVTVGISSFQELLLGLEATREEPPFSDPEAILQLERQAQQPIWSAPLQDLITVSSGEVPVIDSTGYPVIAMEQADSTTSITAAIEQLVDDRIVDEQLLVMLDQFVVKLDDTCHRLHQRILADEAPYVTTTSRLEHLSRTTRELVSQISERSAAVGISTSTSRWMPAITTSVPAESLLTERTLDSVVNDASSIRVSDEADGTIESRTELIDVGSSASGNPHSQPASRRVVVLEESLFYRHLIMIALQSAGYVPMTLTDLGANMAAAGEYGAILVGSSVSPAAIEFIERCRREQSTRIIGLTQPGRELSESVVIDNQVAKSHPQQLISLLDQELGSSAESIRKSA